MPKAELPKRSISLTLDPTNLKKLEEMAAKDGRSLSGFVDKVIREWFEKQEPRREPRKL